MSDEEGAIPLEGDDELEPLPVEGAGGGAAEATEVSAQGSSKIHAFGAAAAAARREKKQWRRPTNLTGAGAVRCRMFHSKVTVAAMDHMVDQINEWLDSQEIEVKYVNQVVGVMEGKTPEPNVIVTVWY